MSVRKDGLGGKTRPARTLDLHHTAVVGLQAACTAVVALAADSLGEPAGTFGQHWHMPGQIRDLQSMVVWVHSLRQVVEQSLTGAEVPLAHLQPKHRQQ